MPLLRSMAKAGWGIGKTAVTTAPGRMATAGAVGATYNAATGGPGENVGDRLLVGGMAGLTMGAGFEVGTSKLTSGAFWRGTGSSAARTASRVGQNAAFPFRAGFNRGKDVYRLSRALGAGRIRSGMEAADVAIGETTRELGRTGVARMGGNIANAAMNPMVYAGLGATGAAAGAGYLGYQGSEMMRQSRVRRFQQSTHGLVQGAHAGRHR